MVCANRGHKYRRQVWSKYGEKSAIWRCEDRFKLGKKSICLYSPTLREDDLHKAIMKAINEVIDNKDNFISTFRSNMLEVIAGYNNEINKKEITKANEILSNINTNLLTFDQELVKRLIESIKVNRNNVIEIIFYCGIVVNEKVE